jgi:hypothetical protein
MDGVIAVTDRAGVIARERIVVVALLRIGGGLVCRGVVGHLAVPPWVCHV